MIEKTGTGKVIKGGLAFGGTYGRVNPLIVAQIGKRFGLFDPKLATTCLDRGEVSGLRLRRFNLTHKQEIAGQVRGCLKVIGLQAEHTPRIGQRLLAVALDKFNLT